MAEEIILLLSNRDTQSLEIDDISKKLKIKDKKALKKVLDELVHDGILDFSSKKKRYLLFENSGLQKGRLKFDKKGNGIVYIDNREIHILKQNLKGASYNDLVAIDIDDRNDTGIVARIIEKDNSNFVGTVKVKNNRYYIEDDRYGLARCLTQARIAEMKEHLMKREASIVKAIGKLSFTIYELQFVLQRLAEAKR